MRKVLMPAALPGLVAVAFSGQGVAAEMTLKFQVPRLNVAEYHRPYLAAYIEKPDQTIAVTLAVFYDLKPKSEGSGTKWLKDLRQWWRKGGRDMQMPADGVSGATRPPGEHALTFTDGAAPLGKLPAGDYQMVVEAARENGGRELVRLPFSWPPKKADSVKAEGQSELGKLSVEFKP